MMWHFSVHQLMLRSLNQAVLPFAILPKSIIAVEEDFDNLFWGAFNFYDLYSVNQQHSIGITLLDAYLTTSILSSL